MQAQIVSPIIWLGLKLCLEYNRERESGWQSGRELDFYPSNPGSTRDLEIILKKEILQ